MQSFFGNTLRQNLTKKLEDLRTDLEDLEHDAEIANGTKKGALRFGECGARESICAFTERILTLYDMAEAGCKFEMDDLTLEEWKGIAMVKRFVNMPRVRENAE